MERRNKERKMEKKEIKASSGGRQPPPPKTLHREGKKRKQKKEEEGTTGAQSLHRYHRLAKHRQFTHSPTPNGATGSDKTTLRFYAFWPTAKNIEAPTRDGGRFL
jgi:hypothetical protein